MEKETVEVREVPQTETKPELTIDTLKRARQLMTKAAQSYINTSTVSNFDLWPIHEKFCVFARTPKSFIKKREINGIMIPYVESSYAQKVLNFIFNFQISAEIIETSLVEEKIRDKKAFCGSAQVKFTFFDARTQREIVRTVESSHRAYANVATTPRDAVKSAVSKAWTVVGRSFGLFSDIKEERAYEDIDRRTMTGEITQQKEKDFTFDI